MSGNLREELESERLERTKLASHYFLANLARQFDEYVWFDETSAVTPLAAVAAPAPELPDTYPFGL